ncbi:hypothetical protein [Sphingomonas sp. UYP23]
MAISTELLPEVDVPFYRRYPDMALLDPHELTQHFETQGAAEGRLASAAAFRENFLEYPSQSQSVLEIGPFCNPCIRGDHVKYFDVLSSSDLKARAEKIGYPIIDVPNIDFFSPNGDLGVVTSVFSAVLSCHCIEHQTDIVKHLRDVSKILDPGGRYFLIVPDKRFCFDQSLADSTIADVIEAHMEQRRAHRIGNIIEHWALTTHNDAARHWQGDHTDLDYELNLTSRIQFAAEEFERLKGAYIDVHAWKFTPLIFRKIVTHLNKMGLIDLYPERVYHTPYGRSEFTAVLRKGIDS